MRASLSFLRCALLHAPAPPLVVILNPIVAELFTRLSCSRTVPSTIIPAAIGLTFLESDERLDLVLNSVPFGLYSVLDSASNFALYSY